MPAKLVNVRGTELLAHDTREHYRQKLARITLDSMAQFVGLLDANGTVLEINHVALDAVGVKLSEVEGKPFWTTFWWQVSDEINRTLREAILRASKGEFVRWDTEIYGRSGGTETIIIDASLMPVKDVQGNVVFITAEGRDITEKKAQEREIARQREELAKLDELKTQFFSNISHEFRTPLTLMMGPLEDMVAQPEGFSPVDRERLELAHRNSLRLLKLVNTLLEFSRIEAGRIQATYELTDLAALTTDLASVFRSATERAGLRLTINCPPLPERLYVDRGMWEKIVLNLVSNAFKFTFEGEIELTLRPASPEAEAALNAEGGPDARKFALLTVRDTGVGIPEEAMPRLFDRFYRVENARSRTQEGTGIGLALVQELVKLQGGVIRAESRLGAGTTFTVAIPFGSAHLPPGSSPTDEAGERAGAAARAFSDEALGWLPGPAADTALAPAPKAGDSDAPPASPNERRARVLLADDNADMSAYLARLLSEHYDVEPVRDGTAALQAARARRPDLILSDVMMPNLDGFGLVREIRADSALKSLPVILLSARAGEESRVDGLKEGADDYLIKPFSARELLARVAAQLTMAQIRREATAALEDSHREAVASNRAKDEFLATLSHELRTPLNPVLLIASESAGDPELPEATRADFKMIADNISLQARLIDDLLDLSRISHGKMVLDQRSLDLHGVIRDAIATIHGEVAAKELKLTLSLNARYPMIDGDPVRLRQVFWNVLRNAVKFTAAGGRIDVSSSRIEASSEIEVRIRDSGVGMGAEEVARIFQPFVQGRHAGGRRHEEFGGLGLGLAISRMLVERHRGSIGAESPGPNQGTTIIIRLPLKLHANPAGPQPEGEAGAGTRAPSPAEEARVERVLFVEDHETSRTTFVRLLKRRGYDVIVASSVAEALETAGRTPFDVLISDLGLPDGDGCRLMREIRMTWPGASGIAISGFGMQNDVARSREAGFEEHLTKPISIDSLERALVRVLERSKTLRQT